MGSSQAKEKKGRISPSERIVEGLKNKVRDLQGQVDEILRIREAESEAYERELMVFALKQAEWKREKQRLYHALISKHNQQQQIIHSELGTNEANLVENKWKQLYFAIKDELDHLIHRTHQEEKLWWKTEKEELLVELKNEVQARGQVIQTLQAKVAKMEVQESKREREMDILKQSLRILSHTKRPPKKLGQKPIKNF
ncbi:hypothetical protein STAS_18400 [Striga asiatica]|uniref:Uncharacterized protein n=1 Tax=Striga asiatica TaxID=4170 RepID=A0A5A7Q8U6_STRAF|nr:hypothetical protein STAS_18400 [Striga asiatica]